MSKQTNLTDESEFVRELRVDEGVEVALAAPRILIGMIFAFIILVSNLGFDAIYGWPALPIILIFVMIFLAMKNFLKVRHKERPQNISKKRITSFLAFAVVMGAGWGIMLSIIIAQTDDPQSRAVALLLAFIGTFATTNINSIRISMGFGFTTLGIIWLTVLLTGALPAFGASVLFVLAYLTIAYFGAQAQKRRAASIKLSMMSTKALQDRFEADEQLRASQLAASKLESERQKEISATQRNVINAIPFPLVLARYDTAFEITPAARRQFRLPEGAKSTDFRLQDFFVDPKAALTILKRAKSDGVMDDFETQMKDTEGNEFWVSISIRSLMYEGEKTWLNAIWVIDARKRMEQDLETARDQAEMALAELHKTQSQLIHSEKMAGLGQLTAGIAHEIKNPLNFVNNFAKLSAEMMDELKEALEDPLAGMNEDARHDAQDLMQTVRENLDKIDQHGTRADSIVKNMLAHSRAETGEREEVAINPLVEEAVNLAYHGARAADSSVNLSIEMDWSADVGMVSAAPQELQRVFMNLCSNGIYAAVKQAEQGGPDAVLRVSTRTEPGFYVVSITDNGAGISPENLKKVFNPFFTTKPTGEGTGLGLSMSFDIVKNYGGTIELDSTENEGTTFVVRLPRTTRQTD